LRAFCSETATITPPDSDAITSITFSATPSEISQTITPQPTDQHCIVLPPCIYIAQDGDTLTDIAKRFFWQ
jgi:hypothetical protein